MSGYAGVPACYKGESENINETYRNYSPYSPYSNYIHFLVIINDSLHDNYMLKKSEGEGVKIA